MNCKNGEENSWPECIEAERSNPTHVTWEIPGVYWLIVLCVNLAWWSHLFLPSFPLSGSLQGRKNTEHVCVISSLPCLSPLQPSSSEFPWQISLPESQLGTYCPKTRKSQYSQAFDVGTCSRYRAQFPVWKLIHSWESKIHTIFCRNLMGNYVWGNFCNLSYANSLFDCNANPWSVLLPCRL